MTNPISDLFTETFDQLSAGQFEKLVRRGGYGFYLFHKNGRYLDPSTKILGHTVDCRRHGLLWARTAGAHCGLLKAQTPVRARTANMPPTWEPIYIEIATGPRWSGSLGSGILELQYSLGVGAEDTLT